MEQSTRGDQVIEHSSDVPGREASRPLRMLVASSLGIATGILATLRSPFLPQAYAAVPPLWLLTLLAAHPRPQHESVVPDASGLDEPQRVLAARLGDGSPTARRGEHAPTSSHHRSRSARLATRGREPAERLADVRKRRRDCPCTQLTASQIVNISTDSKCRHAPH